MFISKLYDYILKSVNISSIIIVNTISEINFPPTLAEED